MSWNYGQEFPIGTITWKSNGPGPKFQFLDSDVNLIGTSNLNFNGSGSIVTVNTLNFTAPAGTGSGVDGKGFTFTTGDGGGGAAASGSLNVTLGAPTGAGLPGNFKITTSAASDRTITNNTPLVVNQFGVGIGSTPQAAVKNVLNIAVGWTDPSGESKASSMSCTINLTGSNAQPNDTLNPSLYIVDGGFNLTSTNGQWSVLSETHVQTPSSGTHAMLGGITGSAWLDAGSTGNATEMRGVQGYVSMGSTATVPLVSGHYSYIQLTPSGGAVDGNITLANGLRCAFANNTSAATPGVIATGEGIRVLAPTFSATGTATTVRGLAIIAQRNTLSSTSITPGFTTQGVYIEVGNQGGNTSGSDNNYGLYITSNGGTPGGGGGVTNRAIFSNSTATSNILAAVRIGSTSTIPTGVNLQSDGTFIQGHTPTAINSSATATSTQVVTGYITSTSAAPTTITLPTGTSLGGLLSATQGTIHDLYIDNTAGANTVTIAVAVNGILSAAAAANGASQGLLTIPSGVTGQACFRLMFSSATAYTFTRVA